MCSRFASIMLILIGVAILGIGMHEMYNYDSEFTCHGCVVESTSYDSAGMTFVALCRAEDQSVVLRDTVNIAPLFDYEMKCYTNGKLEDGKFFLVARDHFGLGLIGVFIGAALATAGAVWW